MKLLKLHEVRERRLLTVRELGAKAGVSPATIVRLEHDGDAAYRTIRKLAEALGVAPEELVG